MKSYFWIYGLLALCVALFTACSDDDGGDNGGLSGKYDKYPYSSLTPEEQKEKLNEDAMALLSDLEGLSSNAGVGVLTTFSNLAEAFDVDGVMGNLIENQIDIIKINHFYGTYTWNWEAENWDFSVNNSQCEFIFPVSAESTSNDAKIVVTGVSSNVTIDGRELYNEEDGGYYEEDEPVIPTYYTLPKSLNANLFINGNPVGNISFEADLVSVDEIPKSGKATFNLTPYSFSMDVKKASPNTVGFVLKKDSKTLINGNFNLDANIDSAMEDEDFIPKNANFAMEVGDNLVFTGNYDIKKYLEAVGQLDSDKEEAYCKGQVDAFNKYSNIFLASNEDKTKIATLRQKAHYYDSWNAVMELQFKDNSLVDAATYFSSGFEQLMSAAFSFINKFMPEGEYIDGQSDLD